MMPRKVDRLWPKIPESLRKKEVRFPREFRDVVADMKYSDTDIGRMVRCLVMETDFFNTVKIGPAVYRFRHLDAKKERHRVVLRRYRERLKGIETPDGAQFRRALMPSLEKGGFMEDAETVSADELAKREETHIKRPKDREERKDIPRAAQYIESDPDRSDGLPELIRREPDIKAGSKSEFAELLRGKESDGDIMQKLESLMERKKKKSQ